MYNCFMLIGLVENITKNTVDLLVEGEHLEVIVEGVIELKGSFVVVKGHIKQDGLYADKIYKLREEE